MFKYISIGLISLGFCVFIESVEEKNFKKVIFKLLLSLILIIAGSSIGCYYE